MKHRTVALVFDYATRAALALALAAPATAAVASTGIGAFPEGDRLLFAPGGMLLLEVARQLGPELGALAASSFAVGVLFAALACVPRAALLGAFSEMTPPPLATFFGRALLRAPGLFALEGSCFLAQALVGALALGTAWMVRGPGSPRLDTWALAFAATGFALLLLLGIVRDLASAALCQGAPGGRAAVRVGLRALWQAPGRAVGRWLGPAVLGLSLVSAAALAVGALDVSRAGAGWLLAVTVSHQIVLVGLTLCRAAWLRAAVELVPAQLAAGSSARR